MGCCENINNFLSNNNNNLSNPFFLNEVNFSKNKMNNSFHKKNKIFIKFIKDDQTPKFINNGNKKYNKLDEISEVESEYKESSFNSRILSLEKLSPRNKGKNIKKLIKDNIINEKLKKRRYSKKFRSSSELETILSEDIFYKKLKEYEKNNKIKNINKAFYLNNLKNRSTKKIFEFNIGKTMGDLSFKNSQYEKLNMKNKSERNNRNNKNELFNKNSYRSKTQIKKSANNQKKYKVMKKSSSSENM